MKKVIAMAMTAALIVAMLACSAGCSKSITKEWYKGALQYYGDGIKNGFTEKHGDLQVPKELEDKSFKCGYLLKDLDGDGVDELLVGIMDNASETKFTNVVVRHSDLGPYCLLGGSDGHYIYLCNDNVIYMKNEFVTADYTDYLRWQPKSNSFLHIEGEGKYLPMKWELTAF